MVKPLLGVKLLCALVAGIAAFGGTFVAPQACAIPVVVNGSFDDSLSSIPGWTTLSGATILFVNGTFGNAEDGSVFLDVSGGFSGGTASIQQTIGGFTIGQSYNLTFWASVNRNTNFTDPSSLVATVGSGDLTILFAPLTTQPWGSPWIFESLYFVATNSTLDLTFTSGRTSTGSLPAIDNVRINAIPEGGCTALLLASALAGLVWSKHLRFGKMRSDARC